MSAQSEELAERVLAVIGDDPNISEKKMFGGICFMLNGNMLVCPMKSGDLLVRVGKDKYADAVALPGAAPMIMSGRTMSGFVQVAGEALDTDGTLVQWIARATDFVGTLPPK
jgi:TfoX/Sxy family transcriptional regulator of competence genes